MDELVLATKNRGKVSEIKKLLKGIPVKILTLDDFPDITLPPEGGISFEENALLKARSVASATGRPALADDSGLEVDSLGGRPGVFSARYAGEGATDKDNRAKLLSEMQGVPRGKRRARFVCALAFSSGAFERTFLGELAGLIAEAPAGTGGFGYDPVFFIPGKKRTAAELTPEEKNSISHRGRALEKFLLWLKSGESI